ncbi:hypothetical protein ACLB2K_035415 [Fragaria x ananassa]
MNTTKTHGFKALEVPQGNSSPRTFLFELTMSPRVFESSETPKLKDIRDMKMMSIFGKKKGVQLLNSEEFEYNELESNVRNSAIPKFEFNQIYKRGNFDLLDSHQFKILEFTTPGTTEETDLLLVTPEEVAKARKRNYKYMHIGAVQVGIKLLTREGLNCSVLCVLQDNRLIDFQKSLLGTLQASLCNQVAYFNCFPNFSTSLNDAAHCLRLRVKTDGTSMKEGMPELAIVYRIYYKLMSTMVEPKTRLSNISSLTTGFLTNPRNHSEQIHKVTWDEVTFPLEWKFSSPKEKPESARAAIYENRRTGDVNLKFEGHRRSDATLECLRNDNSRLLRRCNTSREGSTSRDLSTSRSTRIIINDESIPVVEEDLEELHREVNMLKSEGLYELSDEADNCKDPARLEQLIEEIKKF